MVFDSCICCVGSGLFYKLITRSEASYRVCARVRAYVIKSYRNPTVRRPGLELGIRLEASELQVCYATSGISYRRFGEA